MVSFRGVRGVSRIPGRTPLGNAHEHVWLEGLTCRRELFPEAQGGWAGDFARTFSLPPRTAP